MNTNNKSGFLSSTTEAKKDPNKVDPTKQDERDNDPTRIKPMVKEPDKIDPTQPGVPNTPTPDTQPGKETAIGRDKNSGNIKGSLI